MADPDIIECEGLHKTYGDVAALRGLELRVPRGSIFGLLGRNGAGKTTTLKVLLGMVHPTGGLARVFGLRVDDPVASVDIRRRTGFVSEDKDLLDRMTVGEIVAFTAGFYPRWRRDLQDDYLRRFALRGDVTVKTLSRGTRTKLALLLALCRGAELLVLDEPTSGLDPAVADEVLQVLVGHVAREELTVLISSHQLGEVDQIADRVAIVHHGRTALTGALDDLRDAFRAVQAVFDGPAPDVTLRTPGIVRTQRSGRVLMVTTNGNAEAVGAEARALGAVSVDVRPVSLKEMFLDIVAAEA